MNVVEVTVSGDKIKPKNPKALDGQGETVPFDPRFPNQNQTR